MAHRNTNIGSHAHARALPETDIAKAIDTGDFDHYRFVILHDWLRTLCLLAAAMVPLFFMLDVFMMPRSLLPRFAVYRAISMALVLVQLVMIRHQKPGRRMFLHAYLMSTQIGLIITLMTIDLGGFNSSYYAGLNLVIIGVNLLMPWRSVHSGVNAAVTIVLYAACNLIAGRTFQPAIFLNNLFFLTATSIVVTCISYVRFRLIKNEFVLLLQVKKTRDALWSEMELAKRIQTALLPKARSIRGYKVATVMLPAREVGGDYFDIIETTTGERWITIGDVSGHGVDSGLIMMMAQTSIMTEIKSCQSCRPADVLRAANVVLRENIARLSSNHYMTLTIMELDDDHVTFAGHHQDIMTSRFADHSISAIPTSGTWLGIADNIDEHLQMTTIDLAVNDMILLFTDGVTEGTNSTGEMFGQERLKSAFERHANNSPQLVLERILSEVQAFQTEQEDDISLVLIQRSPQ
ncbi:MAG: SpoIIE family protein phosphatase [Spirochaetota bacterium]|mgnify:FL=1